MLAGGEASAPALLAPGRAPLTYVGLREQAAETAAALGRLGAGGSRPVAIVLPNGPEMAAAFVSVAAAGATAPLNPAYRRDEFEFYLGDLDARLLIVEEGSESPALDVARERGMPVAFLRADTGGPAGRFELAADGGAPAGPAEAAGLPAAGPDDTALILHTSGTTSRPKIVPLTQSNLCASAAAIAASLALQPADRCLNVMPLFHIHGLVAALLSSLHAGAGVACTPGFNALHFYLYLRELSPTWYTAVPTMHQAIVARAARNREIVDSAGLRLIRSSSAPLPPQVMTEIEKTFDAPVIEAYGMTEAAHQMASNPLPPAERKPGSVGRAAGPEIAVMDEGGRILPAGSTGEVVIRGDNVTPGYLNNPDANAAAFRGGWFRTGDQGHLDDDGYLWLTGRLKEIINRGGEKISPREVDEVILDHPDVVQAVTFAIPHDKLGEDVAVAVVLREGASTKTAGIRAFAAQRVVNFKVPRKVVIVDEIPKGATGKLQRIGLAERLGLA